MAFNFVNAKICNPNMYGGLYSDVMWLPLISTRFIESEILNKFKKTTNKQKAPITTQ